MMLYLFDSILLFHVLITRLHSVFWKVCYVLSLFLSFDS